MPAQTAWHREVGDLSQVHSFQVPSPHSNSPCNMLTFWSAGQITEADVKNKLLKSFSDIEDPTSLEGRLTHLVNICQKDKKPTEWQEAHLHSVLAQYLASTFPHSNSEMPGSFESAQVLFDHLDKKLYPWVPNQFDSSLHWRQFRKGRGLVTSVPSKYVDMAFTNLKGLRIILGCDLPIHVYFVNDNDLSEAARQRLESIGNLYTFSLSEIFAIQLVNFQVKPFSMLASGFAEVIWFDVDLMFLENPEVLFEEDIYQETGTVLFHDRTLIGWGSEKGPDINWKWVHQVIGRGSDYLRCSHAFNEEASHIVDSSAVVMHVSRNFYPMLVISRLNIEANTYSNVYGDKETFWLGFEILRKPWALNQWGLSGVTFMHRKDSECTGDGNWDKAAGANLLACAHMGPADNVRMIHFSESKYHGPAPFSVIPVGYVPDVDKVWRGTCVQFGRDDIKEFRWNQLDIFKKYIDVHKEHALS